MFDKNHSDTEIIARAIARALFAALLALALAFTVLIAAVLDASWVADEVSLTLVIATAVVLCCMSLLVLFSVMHE